MSSLPPDLDFAADRSATPERMNRAMEYILARLRAVESITPNLEAIVGEMRAFGVARVAEAITPIRLEVVRIYDELQALLAAADSNTVDELLIARAKAVTLAEIYSKAEVRALVDERALASEVYSRDAADARFAPQVAFEAALLRLLPPGGTSGMVLSRNDGGAAVWSAPTLYRWEEVGTLPLQGALAQFSNITARFDDFLIVFQNLETSASSLQYGASSDGVTWVEQSIGAYSGGITGTFTITNRRAPAGLGFIWTSGIAPLVWALPGGVNAVRLRGTFTGGTARLFAR